MNFEKTLKTPSGAADTADTAATDGLPNGCLAPVDKPPQGPDRGPSPCPQASPLDNPAPEHAAGPTHSTDVPKT